MKMFQRRWCHYQLKREITEFEVIERDNKLNKQFHLSGCMFGKSAYAYPKEMLQAGLIVWCMWNVPHMGQKASKNSVAYLNILMLSS